jgi:hypothetical protein
MYGIGAACTSGKTIMRRMRFSVLPACLLLAVGGPVMAQSTQGSILGTVKDASGAVIPGARITVQNVGLGRTTVLVANARGDFQLLNLEPGRYSVSTSFAGYETYLARDLVLSAHQQLRVDPMLKVGSVNQQVSVDASGLGNINTDTPVISATLNARDVTNLPANYRGAGSTSPLNIIQVMPGVQADSGTFPPAPTSTATPAINFSIQGGLPSQSDATVDGISAQSVLSNAPLSNAFPSAEDIAEIRVDGVGNNAEYGQPAVITTVTKSGTNDYHGGLFWYFQNSGLDATPFGSAEKPKKVGNDFGGSLGGPVRIPRLYNGHDKTFFFGDYEGFHFPQSATEHYIVPTDLMKQGNFINEAPAGTLANPFMPGTYYANNTVPVGTAAQAYMNLFPSPNVGNPQSLSDSLSTVGYNYIANKPETYTSDQFDARVDQYFGQKALVFARYTWKNISLQVPQNLNVPNSNDYDDYRILVTSFNYNFTPRLINEFRFGFTIESYGKANSFNGAAVANAAQINGVGPSYPFNGITELDFGTQTSLNSDRLNDSEGGRLFQYTDNVTWSKGAHTFKFGGDLKHVRANPPTSFHGADNYGTFSFDGNFTGQEFADFELGLPTTSVVDDLPGEYEGQSMVLDMFAQDNWQATPNLTLTYGLRYEIHPPYSDPGGDLGNFDASVPLSGRVLYPAGHANILSVASLSNFNACPTTGVDNPYATGNTINGAPCTPVVDNVAAGLPAGLRNWVKDRLVPRFGFAWRPFQNDNTSIRGGFGVFNITELGSGYYSMTAALQAAVRIFNNTETASGPAFAFPNTGTGATVNSPVYGTSNFGTGNSVNWKDPYSMQWHLSFDHQFGQNVGIRMSYIGMKTDDLVWGPDVNDMSLSSSTKALSRPLTDRPFPNWGIVNERYTGGQANYHSLQLEATRRLARGLQFNSAYTLSKNLADNAGTNPSSFSTENGGRATWAQDRGLDYGNVYGDRRQRWISTATYDLPFGRGREFGSSINPFEDAFLGGWRLANIFLIQTGPFMTPFIPSGKADPSGTGSGIIASRAQRPDRLGSGVPHNRTRNAWLDPKAFPCPSNSGYTSKSYAGNACTVGVSTDPIGRFGTSSVGDVVGPGTVNLSSGLSKVFDITARFKFRLEGTFTNVLNHANLQDPNLQTTSAAFGKITAARGSDFSGSRTGQISARLEF